MDIRLFTAGVAAAVLVLPSLAVYAADSATTSTPTKQSTAGKVKENVNDAVITAKVKAEFAKDKDVSAMRINVDTDDKGVVTLRGTVKSPAEADKAVQIARNTAGVTQVRNELKVGADGTATSSGSAKPAAATTGPSRSKGSRNSDQPIDDTIITTRVKARLATAKGVHASDIHVKTTNGVVELTGTARSKSEVSRAVSIARRVPNVKSVNNRLQIAAAPARASQSANVGAGDEGTTAPGKSTAAINNGKPTAGAGTRTARTAQSNQPIDDTVITTRVKARMATDKQVDAVNIHVKTTNGVVALSGTAKSKAEADKAVAIARGVDHVKSVRNEIHVQ